MKEIKLTQGKCALVDDDMYDELNKFKWCANKGVKTYYAVRAIGTFNGKRSYTKIHHEVLGHPSGGYEIDHIDGNGLNNQRNNLRFVTRRQNQQNRINQKSSSKYPGVHWDSGTCKWRSRLKVGNNFIHLGLFNSELIAYETYHMAVTELARDNF